MSKLLDFYRTSSPVPRKDMDGESENKYYKRLRLQSFFAVTLGYSLYYVCRTSLNVMKKPILDSGALDATQLGLIGSCLLFAYAIGKFVNGFLADHCNVKRFMATGLIISSLANAVMGILGFAYSIIPTSVLFVSFAILWAMSGWAQSVGSPASVVTLSRWFTLKDRGTFYGFFSSSHNIGEYLSFIFVGFVVSTIGWQAGFLGAAVAGILGVILIVFFLHDTPESKGLAPIESLAHEKTTKENDESVSAIQKQVLRTPAVWILAAASAFMYIARYAITGWGIVFLQEEKGFDFMQATSIVSLNALFGIFGTILSGWFSDKVFKGDRTWPALIFGVLLSVGLVLFLYGGNALWVNYLSMILFGVAVGVLICFLGGLMAVDIVPRKASGAALGVVGIASYVAAGIQDVASGWLIDSNVTILADGSKHYDFTEVGIFWLAASIISFLLPLINIRYKIKQE